MQTIERPTSSSPRRPSWSWVAGAAAAVLIGLPVLLLAIATQWGVLALLILAAVFGIIVWARERRIAYFEVAAFLIHFDGIGMGPIRMGRFVAAFAVILIAYKLIFQRWRPRSVPVRAWAPIWVLLVWSLVSGMWAGKPGVFINTLLMFGLGMVYFGVTALLVESHEDVRRFLRAFWIGGLFGSAVGVLGLAVGGRSQGFGGDPNFFGLLVAAMIPLTVYYWRNATTRAAKYWYAAALVMVLGGEAGAGSRSGLIAASIAIVATMVTRPGLSVGGRSRVAVLAVFLGALAFVAGFVSNPSNLARGFADRGAGRLDFFAVTVPLIEQQPLTGYGLGQLGLFIPPQLRLTPGSQTLEERREGVSSHNTYLDTIGDLGVIGFGMFVSVFAVAVVGLVRPRWRKMRELSTTIAVMFLPVFSSSMFLPLLNNKLAWSLVGLSAALQVRSDSSRWTGLAGDGAPALRSTASVPAVVAAPAAAVAVRSQDERNDGSAQAIDGADVTNPDEELAAWDLRLSARARRWIVAAALVGAVLAASVAARLPTHYDATMGILVRRVDTSVSMERYSIDYQQLQGVLTLAVSGAFATELQRLSGVDLTVEEIRERMSVTRLRSSNVVEVVFSDTDEGTTRQVQPYLLPALEAVVDSVRATAVEETMDELRPAVPGEQRFYTGPLFTPAYPEATFGARPQRTSWIILVGGVSAAVGAIGVALAGSRRPRVRGADDFPVRTGLRIWSHVGIGTSRRRRTTAAQYEQVLASVVDAVGGDEPPGRIVVAAPRADPETRRVALGTAAAAVAAGRRVVLVDAQLERPRLGRQLGVPWGPGLADLASTARTRVGLADVLRPVAAWRLGASARRLTRGRRTELRVITAGRRRSRSAHELDPTLLDDLDADIVTIVLAPPLLGEVPVHTLLEWGQASVVALVEGHTTTVDTEDAAAVVRLFSGGPSGIVIVSA